MPVGNADTIGLVCQQECRAPVDAPQTSAVLDPIDVTDRQGIIRPQGESENERKLTGASILQNVFEDDELFSLLEHRYGLGSPAQLG